jgi:hypothetical protein
MQPIQYAEIVIKYDGSAPRHIFCALEGLPEDPTRDEVLEAAEAGDFITDTDLNFDITAVIITEEEYEDGTAVVLTE